MQSATEHFFVEERKDCNIIHLISPDHMNRLTGASVRALKALLEEIGGERQPAANCSSLIITGNDDYFSVGADLNEIAVLTPVDALEFARCGQQLMELIDDFPAPVYAAISGYCMGGGLDLALACDFRLSSANAVFGHRGAALGLITGWGGTQRLPALIGRGKSLQMFAGAERLHARDALEIGLVDGIAPNPLARCLELIEIRSRAD